MASPAPYTSRQSDERPLPYRQDTRACGAGGWYPFHNFHRQTDAVASLFSFYLQKEWHGRSNGHATLHVETLRKVYYAPENELPGAVVFCAE